MEIIIPYVFNLVAILVGFTLHEFSHAYSAFALGDPTAKYQGRLTLNPIAHLDPIGTIVLVVSSFMGMGVGWAKPVPVNPYNFRHPRTGDLLVSLAGPMMNFALAAVAGSFIKFNLVPADATYLAVFLDTFVRMNCMLGVFNLLPCPPLDGWHVLVGLLPSDIAYTLKRLEAQYGMYAPMLIIFVIMSPLGFFIFQYPAFLLFRLFAR
jgi:Zn-dependent protease